jgi:hypothetical protein
MGESARKNVSRKAGQDPMKYISVLQIGLVGLISVKSMTSTVMKLTVKVIAKLGD